MRNHILFIILAFLLPVCSYSQTKNMNTFYSKEWKQIDSLISKGLPKSAQAIIEKVLKETTAKKDIPDKVKARILLTQVKFNAEEDSKKKQIKTLESYIAESTDIEKAIWQSLTADLYWNYYQNNRYKIYNRTKLDQTVSDDIDTWDADALMNRIAELFEASLEQKELLQTTPVADYEPIIIKGKNTASLRPTLYDLLAFKAIDFFKNEEAHVVKAADAFQMDGTLWFETADKFSAVKVKVKDGSSFKFRTLRLFQNVIAFHLNDEQPDALIDADLLRLEFVHSNSVNTQKDSLYVSALQNIATRYPASPSTAQALYLIANQQMNNAPQKRGGRYIPASKSNVNLPAIKKQLENIIAKFPKTEGAFNAQNLLNQITAPSLSIQTEAVNIPDENIKALVSYKNAPVVFLKLYKIPLKINKDDYETEEVLLKRMQILHPIKTWQQVLPGTSDYEAHNTEIKIDALPAGNYALVSATKNEIESQGQILNYSEFQVSNISFVAQQDDDKKGFVLNRKTGYPLKDTKVYFYAEAYENSGRQKKELYNGVSDESGIIRFPITKNYDYNKQIRGTLFVNGTDSLFLQGYVNNQENEKSNQSRTQTFFFTDRTIYRPGQILHFKGIMVRSSADLKKNEVVVNENTIVTLMDANGQQQGTLNLRTNEFGSFSGTFQLPEGLMNGQMHINNENGSQYFSVEEYKRPKFFVEFDTLKGSYALNESVTVKGFSKAYAGNNIDGATVKYRVVRKARFPYYWYYYFWGMSTATETEIANGILTTQADGSFEIPFRTIPDLSIEPKSMPVFYYEVYADITDINGETRSGNISLVSGYTSLQIKANIPEQSKPKDLEQLSISTENLNGVFKAASVHVSIAHLKFPGFLRKRLWALPDEFVMNETEFHQAFPADEYKEESNHLNWAIEKVLFEKTFTTTKNEKLPVPAPTWYQNGWYVIEIKTKDAQGHEIIEKKYTNVWAPAKKEANQEALMAYTEKDSYEPGEKIEIWVGTGIDNPNLLHASSMDYKVRNPIYIDVQEKDRGGMAFSWLYVSNNRVYSLEKTINVPWSNKDLQTEWATHRDKLHPGAKEQWTFTIKGNKKEKVAAELLTGLYDASLDAFKPHNWTWNKLFPSIYANDTWNNNWGFGAAYSRQLIYNVNNPYGYYEKGYDKIIGMQGTLIRLGNFDFETRFSAARSVSSEDIMYKSVEGAAPGVQVTNGDDNQVSMLPPRHMKLPVSNISEDKSPESTNVQIRKNLQETAFFFPQLKTDSAGNISFSFTIPEALTEWKMMAFAHTKDWATSYMEGKVKTQKDLMVVPNLPRFLRQGDNIQFSTKIVNLSDNILQGNASIELLDAQTLQAIPLTQFMQLRWSIDEQADKAFNVTKGQSTIVNWNLHIPESRYTPVIVRITAKSGSFSDGEENTLPVITNRMLVTETMPISIKGNESKNYTFEKLVKDSSRTQLTQGLTVEFTGNPAWYAVQSLPYLMEYPYDCAEQTFNRFYANALAQNIVAQSPTVQQIFNRWQQKDSAALISNLEKNEELKTALLEETPWVMDAKNETEQKHRLALLFQTNKLSKEFKKTLEKLIQMQLPDGSFPWFQGMDGDRFITQYILTGMGRLQNLNVKNLDKDNLKQMYSKALHFADAKLIAEYNQLLKDKADLNAQHIYSYQVQYLYMRSFYSENAVNAADKKAFEYYKKQAAKYWAQFNPYLKGQLALALNRMGDTKTALQIMASLKETAIQNQDLGMYWKDMPRGYSWSELPIESQSLLIEAFSEITKDMTSVEAMKLWLLKNKQTQNWNTTKATADACYALLLSGSDWLNYEPDLTIQLGDKKVESSDISKEAGTGYFKKKFDGKDVTKNMGNIMVRVENSKIQIPNSTNQKSDIQSQTSWGAVYWQYFEQMDKITSITAAPIILEKQLFIEKNNANGPVLTEIKEGNTLQVGDKVKIRIVVKVDRDMEYVQLKDMRAACFEPVDVLSEYKYQNGIGYFQSTKDIATNFFFDHLSRGTYIFEYPVWVNAKGNFSNGITTIQCMYAPEFSSHTEGIRVEVK